MGCCGSYGNFNNLHYENGKWWAAWGLDFTLTAPTVDPIREYLGDRIVNFNLVFNADKGTWTAWPNEKPVLD